MRKAMAFIVWLAVAVAGAAGYVAITLHRGEPLNAVWLLMAAVCTYAIGYRFYSKWIAARIMALDDLRATPCEVHEDGRDFVKTNQWIVFGHHFAAISGPGPLVGPVLAAQFGYLPGTLWILIGVVLGGAVQDFIILFCSIRRDAKSLGQMIKEEIGNVAGLIALLAILAILVILVAVLGLVVVKALAHSPWGTFTIAATIPIALFMGVYLRFLRPGKVLEVTVLGVTMLLLSVWAGKFFHELPALAAIFTLNATTLAWAIIAYGLAASVLPVWLLLAPRDYLSTFMKLGTILGLALGILVVLPTLKFPAVSQFVDGSGPVFAGKIFPFCFITIACGAISGFHALIASGTTPKLITRESYVRPIGYGSMLLESAVAIMAMIAACTLDPGIYFAINSPAGIVGTDAAAAVSTISSWGFPVTAQQMTHLAQQIGETTMFGRTGGAPTLAVGMAMIFAKVLGESLMGLWYHFAIMFEALFILTTLDAGTRVGRFILQDFLRHIWRPLGNIHSYCANIFASSLLVGAWGYFMYQGVIDPYGGINSLWPLFGIANQLLSVIALCLATTVLIKMGKRRFMWLTVVPLIWLVSVTFAAGLQKIGHDHPRIGFLAQANRLTQEVTQLERQLTAEPQLAAAAVAKIQAQMAVKRRDIFNQRLDAVIAGLFLCFVGAIVITSLWRWICLLSGRSPLDLKETPPVWRSKDELAIEPVKRGWDWLWAMVLIALSLLRHLAGESQLARAKSQTSQVACADRSCQALASSQESAATGKLWAELEEQRFRNHRCC